MQSLPILRAFCLFAASGVMFVYIFATTFFVGCMALDERRIGERRVLHPCGGPQKPADWKPNEFSQRDYGKLFFEKVACKVVFWKPAMVINIIAICISSVTHGFP